MLFGQPVARDEEGIDITPLAYYLTLGNASKYNCGKA